MTRVRPSQAGLVRRYVTFVLRHRVLVLLAFAALSVASGMTLTHAVIASSPKKLFFGDSPDFARYIERCRLFANDEVVLVGVSAPDILAPEALARLQAATEAIEAMPEVAHVDSPATVRLVEGRPGRLVVERLVDRMAEGPDAAAAARRTLLDDPLYRGLVVSDDQRAGLVVVELTVQPDRQAEGVPALVGRIAGAVRTAGFPADAIHLRGLLPEMAACVDSANGTLRRLTPAVVAVLLVVVFVLFRRLWPVTVTGTVAAVATLWTMGFAVALDPEVNIMLAVVPGVILIIAFSDVIHLCSAYLQLVTAGHPKDEAILDAGSEVGLACVLTSATTFVGFGAMALVPTPVFRSLDLVLGFGVAVALLIALTLAPILFSLLPTPRPVARPAHGALSGLDALVDACRRLGTGHPRRVIAAFAVLVALSAVGLARFRVDTDFVSRFDDDHPVRVAERFFAAHFAGSVQVDLFLESDAEDGLKEPAVVARLAALQGQLQARDGIGAARSYADLLRHIHRALNTGDAAAGPLPTSRPMIAQYLLLFEMAGGDGVERLIDVDGRHARLALQFTPSAFRVIARLADAAADEARVALGPAVRVEVQSVAHLFGGWLDAIIEGQRNGLVYSALLIALVMAAGLRSLTVGLWSMVPNLLPLVALGGLLGFTYDAVDSDALVVGMIALGIGVDDTIHFLSRLRVELGRGDGDLQPAVARTFALAGGPIVMTTVILGLGFLPLAFSDYYSIRVLGTLLPFTLVVALIADLLLVPAMVTVGWIRWPARAGQVAPEA